MPCNEEIQFQTGARIQDKIPSFEPDLVFTGVRLSVCKDSISFWRLRRNKNNRRWSQTLHLRWSAVPHSYFSKRSNTFGENRDLCPIRKDTEPGTETEVGQWTKSFHNEKFCHSGLWDSQASPLIVDLTTAGFHIIYYIFPGKFRNLHLRWVRNTSAFRACYRGKANISTETFYKGKKKDTPVCVFFTTHLHRTVPFWCYSNQMCGVFPTPRNFLWNQLGVPQLNSILTLTSIIVEPTG